MDYERVVITGDPDAIEAAVREFDTVCLGLPTVTEGGRPAVDTLTERVVRGVPCSAVLVRGPSP
ncbi:hypothetical protein [Halomarina litorea]|uniref:hypothetical protein n=1 Tax=Halomarina litorea TaxID=2961595 RepID=UPI0020C4D237|nr:hypothetical protein [Halomarina sp. BCD28]